LVNAAIDDCTIGDLGVVVMDELHMLDDESRGYILELMATKLLSLENNVQVRFILRLLRVCHVPFFY
jgi:replicative superfamily II helicase